MLSDLNRKGIIFDRKKWISHIFYILFSTKFFKFYSVMGLIHSPCMFK